MDESYNRVKSLLEENVSLVKTIASSLAVKETLTREEFLNLFESTKENR